ncbi:sigma-70 family RNA polymerase sigma factor [Polyangium sp. 6x1]|uniref:RNA polymerase sigma factor n=1 Tax=Polyangium sp. 6x1 TaxID=3042689 RepID=UPI0024831716|nr:sigma-70 family RNA polymerase sigma factor [Polyangium sp. 6x1]MDI1445780.1 sigma-70 family RNA polymerase sigma factor [Polyangium sp. 6x1]
MNLAPSLSTPPGHPSADELAALRPVVLAWTERWTTCPEDRDDITQEVMFEAEKSRQTNPPVGPLPPWLWVIAARTAARFLRRKQMPGVRLARRVGAMLRIPSAGPSPEEIATNTNALELVAAVRPELPPRMQAVFSAYCDQHMTHDEIAEALGIPPERSRVYLCQAMERIAAAMATAKRKRRGIVLPLFIQQWFRGDGSRDDGEPSGRSLGTNLLPEFPALPRLADAAGSWLGGLVLGGAIMGAYLLLFPGARWASHLPEIQVHVTDASFASHAVIQCKIPEGEPEIGPEIERAPCPEPVPTARPDVAPTVPSTIKRKLDALRRENTHDPKDH